MLFKGKDFESFFDFEIPEKIPDALYRCSPLGVDTTIWFGKKEDNFVSRLVWSTEPKDKSATMLAIICELIREKDATISVSVHNQIIKKYLEEKQIAFDVQFIPYELRSNFTSSFARA